MAPKIIEEKCSRTKIKPPSPPPPQTKSKKIKQQILK
jgi:hypothetical protein